MYSRDKPAEEIPAFAGMTMGAAFETRRLLRRRPRSPGRSATPGNFWHASGVPSSWSLSGFASDGQIVLNVSPSAVRHLHMDNDAVSFEGRFGGVPQSLYIPSAAVLAIYARENGQGMVFEVESSLAEDEEPEGPDDQGPPDGEPPRPSGRPSLKVVK
jgi:stringent starvation protein B